MPVCSLYLCFFEGIVTDCPYQITRLSHRASFLFVYSHSCPYFAPNEAIFCTPTQWCFLSIYKKKPSLPYTTVCIVTSAPDSSLFFHPYWDTIYVSCMLVPSHCSIILHFLSWVAKYVPSRPVIVLFLQLLVCTFLLHYPVSLLPFLCTQLALLATSLFG